MIRQWTNAGSSTDWYTAANWAPPAGAGGWGTGDIAEIANIGTATLAQINMNAGNLSLGAINATARTRDLTIGNSSMVAGTGLLQLNGATIRGTNNVILSTDANIPPYTLYLVERLSGSVSRMGIVLGNATDNVVLLNGEEGSAIEISAPISGAGKKLTLGMRAGGASAGRLILSGANTYTGKTTVSARHGSITLARFGGNTLPATNDVDILDGAMFIKSNQTLRNVKVGALGFLNIDPGVILTITGRLDLGSILSPGGGIRGTVVFP